MRQPCAGVSGGGGADDGAEAAGMFNHPDVIDGRGKMSCLHTRGGGGKPAPPLRRAPSVRTCSQSGSAVKLRREGTDPSISLRSQLSMQSRGLISRQRDSPAPQPPPKSNYGTRLASTHRAVIDVPSCFVVRGPRAACGAAVEAAVVHGAGGTKGGKVHR